MGIWPVSKGSRLNRILTIRWSGQLTDGLFQSALASFVLFSPERAPNAISAALAFAVVLLPYSLIGPYVGIFLDRFSRQRIIRNCNYLRAANLLIIAWLVNSGSTGVVLTLFVLFAFGVNRLILAGLSAGLPLLVKKEELIAANALAVTGGTVWVVIGGGIGIAIKNLLSKTADADYADRTSDGRWLGSVTKWPGGYSCRFIRRRRLRTVSAATDGADGFCLCRSATS